VKRKSPIIYLNYDFQEVFDESSLQGMW
jgi:hypothetical protein